MGAGHLGDADRAGRASLIAMVADRAKFADATMLDIVTTQGRTVFKAVMHTVKLFTTPEVATES